MSLSTATRQALAEVYERLENGELTVSMGAGGYSTRTLDALQSRELITWRRDASTWRKNVTLTTAGLVEIARYFRYCPRCHSTVRDERRPRTIGYGSHGEVLRGPCPCRWHDDDGLSI